MAVGTAIIAGLGLGLSAYQGQQSYKMQKESQAKQDQAIKDAEAKQDEADLSAETKRLEALAANTSGDSTRINKFDFGIDSQSATTMPAIDAVASTTSDEEDEFNPFYTRGLV